MLLGLNTPRQRPGKRNGLVQLAFKGPSGLRAKRKGKLGLCHPSHTHLHRPCCTATPTPKKTEVCHLFVLNAEPGSGHVMLVGESQYVTVTLDSSRTQIMFCLNTRCCNLALFPKTERVAVKHGFCRRHDTPSPSTGFSFAEEFQGCAAREFRGRSTR